MFYRDRIEGNDVQQSKLQNIMTDKCIKWENIPLDNNNAKNNNNNSESRKKNWKNMY